MSFIIKPNSLADTGTKLGATGVESLNRDCFRISLDAEVLKRVFETDAGTRKVYPLILEKCPHLFAAVQVFVSRPHLERMAAVVRAAQMVIAILDQKTDPKSLKIQ